MSEYLPLFKPGTALSPAAGAAIVAGQLVAVNTDATVSPASAGSTSWLGVAGYDAPVGTSVTVFSGGVQLLKAFGAITAGSLVQAGAAGTVASGGTGAAVVGLALSTAADGAQVQVKLVR